MMMTQGCVENSSPIASPEVSLLQPQRGLEAPLGEEAAVPVPKLLGIHA
jgi:hypothetical protein